MYRCNVGGCPWYIVSSWQVCRRPNMPYAHHNFFAFLSDPHPHARPARQAGASWQWPPAKRTWHEDRILLCIVAVSPVRSMCSRAVMSKMGGRSGAAGNSAKRSMRPLKNVSGAFFDRNVTSSQQ
jgi:hypothetical protein